MKGGAVLNREIILAGSMILDKYYYIEKYPEKSTLSTIKKTALQTGGLVCNCALGLSRIDSCTPISVIGRLGDDADGLFITDELKKYPNIDTGNVIKSGETSYTVAMVSMYDKTRTFFQYRGANDLLDICDFDFDFNPGSLFHIGYALLLDKLDSYDKDYGTRLAYLLFIAQNKYGLKTSIDVVSEDSDRFSTVVVPALKYCDYAIMNEYEASKTTGIPVRDENNKFNIENALTICRKMFDYGVSTWTIIHSREGCVALSSNGEKVIKNSIQLDSKYIRSSVGAGDAFASGCLYGIYNQFSLDRTIKIALSSAVMSLMGDNATEGIVPLKELEKYYDVSPKESNL